MKVTVYMDRIIVSCDCLESLTARLILCPGCANQAKEKLENLFNGESKIPSGLIAERNQESGGGKG